MMNIEKQYQDCVWRRPDGRECRTCSNLCGTYYGPRGITKADLEKDMKNTEKKRKHLELVVKYEDTKDQDTEKEDAEVAAKRRRIRDVAPLVGDSEISLQRDAGLNMDEELGNFWPLDVFKKNFPDRPDPVPEAIMELIRDGKPVRGVILEPDGKTAIGVIHLTSHRGLRAVRNTLLANTVTSITSGHLDDVYAAVNSRLQVSTAAVPVLKANDEAASMAKGSVMKKRNLSIKDSDSDFNLDAILGKTELRVSGGGKADTGSKAETGNCKAEQSDDQNKPKKTVKQRRHLVSKRPPRPLHQVSGKRP